MFNQKFSLFIMLIVLASCGQRIGQKRAPKEVVNSEPFKNSPVQVFISEMAAMGSESRGILLPALGESITYEASFSIIKKIEFPKVDGTTKFTCSFDYKKAKFIEKIVKVDGENYFIQKTFMPIEAVFTGSPVSDWQKKCEKDLTDGKYVREYNYLIKDRLEKFKSFVRENFVDKYNKCSARVRPIYLTCKDNGIEIEKKVDEHADFFQMIFAGSLKGNPLNLNITLNFEKIYFTNFGILEMEVIGTTTSGLSNIVTLKTIDWKL